MSDCVVWTGNIDPKGYGRTGRRQRAHRVAFERERGPIPLGFVIDHTCRNRACVNPAHLRAVTPRVNALENSIGITARNAAKGVCPKCAGPYRVRRCGRRECAPCQVALVAKWKKGH